MRSVIMKRTVGGVQQPNYCKILGKDGGRVGEGPGKIMMGGSTTKADYLTVPPTKLLWIRLKKWVI